MGSRTRSSSVELFYVMSVIVSGYSAAISFSEYEEMGPLDVVVFQTSMPSLADLAACDPLSVEVARVPSEASYEEPTERLLIAAPSSQAGEYPVFLFKHGTNVANCLYSQLLQHIASYGYVVVAPQTAFDFSFKCESEIDGTAEVVNWLWAGNLAILLASTTSAGVTPNVEKVFLAGHSRGAKVMFALALGLTESVQPAFSNFSGLVALDPVDATVFDVIFFNVTMQTTPPIVTRSVCELGYPTIVEGTGLGGEGLVPCAPAGYNHQAFFDCTSSPIAYHLVATQYGHMDFLDDGFSFIKLMCPSGTQDHDLLRNFTAGVVLSFLESALIGTTSPMEDVLANWESASIKLDEPECSRNHSSITCPGMSSPSSLTG